MSRAARPAAFTLVELLVVLAVLAVLLAILLPVFARGRARARTTSCISNLRSLGVAIAQYASDHDDLYPIGKDAPVGSYDSLFHATARQQAPLRTAPLLRDVLRGYTGGATSGLWRCENDTGWPTPLPFRDGTGNETRVTLSPSAWETLGTSYMYRVTVALVGARHPARCVVGDAEDGRWGPEKTLLLADLGGYHAPDGMRAEFTQPSRNILFADGHVRTEIGGVFVAGQLCDPE